MPVNELRKRDALVQSLSMCLADGGFALDKVPTLVRRVLRKRAWQERIVKRTGETARFTSFEAFVTTPPLEGLGSTVRQLKNCCRDDIEALGAIDEALDHGHGGMRRGDSFKNNNIKLENPPLGTSRANALRRLRKQRPDLHRQVLDKKLTAHAAMVQAGFRHRTITLPVDDLQALTGGLRRALGSRWTEFCRYVVASDGKDFT